MVGYEYKVIPAPLKGIKAPGVKGPEARFAHALERRINELASEGWQYQRADILPSEERQGLTSSHTVYRSVLVFRREVFEEAADEHEEAPVTTTAGDESLEAEAESKAQSDPETETFDEDEAAEEVDGEKHPA